MKLSARLLITLIFCFLILPFIVKHFGLLGFKQNKNIKESYEKVERDIKSTKNNYTAKLLDSIDRLSLRDPALKKCVTNSLEKFFTVSNPEKHIQDAADMQSLSCYRQDITSIAGIKSMKNLEFLDLSDNKIEDATPLSRLTKLKKLSLNIGNKDIENIDALTSLYKLEQVNFPNLRKSFCHQLDRVVENMENYNDKVQHNAKRVDCRGKKTGAVVNALKKQEKGKGLTEKEIALIADYEENLSWK